MVRLLETPSLQGVLGKEIPPLLAYFSSVPKIFLHLSMKQPETNRLMESLFAEAAQELFISSSLMKASFFTKQRTKNAKILLILSINKKRLRGRKLILTSHQPSLARHPSRDNGEYSKHSWPNARFQEQQILGAPIHHWEIKLSSVC